MLPKVHVPLALAFGLLRRLLFRLDAWAGRDLCAQIGITKAEIKTIEATDTSEEGHERSERKVTWVR